MGCRYWCKLVKLRNRHGGLCFGHFAWGNGEGSRIVVSVEVRYLVSKRNLQLARLLVWEHLLIQSWIQLGGLVLQQRLCVESSTNSTPSGRRR